jgi:hypothetical protein
LGNIYEGIIKTWVECGKVRFSRGACGKLTQICGKPVEMVGRKTRFTVETVWNDLGKVGLMLSYVIFSEIPQFGDE